MFPISEIIAREIGTREIFDNNYANKHYTDTNSINSGNNVDELSRLVDDERSNISDDDATSDTSNDERGDRGCKWSSDGRKREGDGPRLC